MKAAGWVSAAVIVGPRVSRRVFARPSVACAVGDVILHRIQARQVEEDDGLPDGVVPDLIEVVLHIAVSLPVPVLDPRARLRRASRVSRSAACGRSRGARIRRRAARHLRRRRTSHGSSAARPLAAGFGRSQVVLVSVEHAPQFGKRASDLRRRGIRVHLETQQEGLNPRVGVLALVAVGGGDALSVVERGPCLLELPGLR